MPPMSVPAGTFSVERSWVEPLGALYHPGLRLNFRGVYGAVVDALNHGAEILPGKASHIVLPGHRATERTVDDAAAALVEPHKARPPWCCR